MNKRRWAGPWRRNLTSHYIPRQKCPKERTERVVLFSYIMIWKEGTDLCSGGSLYYGERNIQDEGEIF